MKNITLKVLAFFLLTITYSNLLQAKVTNEEFYNRVNSCYQPQNLGNNRLKFYLSYNITTSYGYNNHTFADSKITSKMGYFSQKTSFGNEINSTPMVYFYKNKYKFPYYNFDTLANSAVFVDTTKGIYILECEGFIVENVEFKAIKDTLSDKIVWQDPGHWRATIPRGNTFTDSMVCITLKTPEGFLNETRHFGCGEQWYTLDMDNYPGRDPYNTTGQLTDVYEFENTIYFNDPVFLLENMIAIEDIRDTTLTQGELFYLGLRTNAWKDSVQFYGQAEQGYGELFVDSLTGVVKYTPDFKVYKSPVTLSFTAIHQNDTITKNMYVNITPSYSVEQTTFATNYSGGQNGNSAEPNVVITTRNDSLIVNVMGDTLEIGNHSSNPLGEIWGCDQTDVYNWPSKIAEINYYADVLITKQSYLLFDYYPGSLAVNIYARTAYVANSSFMDYVGFHIGNGTPKQKQRFCMYDMFNIYANDYSSTTYHTSRLPNDIESNSRWVKLPSEYEFCWLHPNWLKNTLRSLKNQLMEGENTEFALKRIRYYKNTIEENKNKPNFWPNNPEIKQSLLQLYTDMSNIINRYEAGLDYFGNPAGWVPMVSLEISSAMFDQEIDYALNAMYLSYWVQHNFENLTDQRSAIQDALQNNSKEVSSLTSEFNALSSAATIAARKFKDLTLESNELKSEINVLHEELIKRAEREIKDEEKRRKKFGFFKSAASFMGSVCSAIPLPATQIIGAGLTGVSEINLDDPFSLENLTVALDATTNAVNSYSNCAKKNSAAMQSIQDQTSSLSSIGSGLQIASEISAAAGPLVSSFNEISGASKSAGVPNSKVQARLQKLMSESPEFKNVQSRLTAVLNKRQEVYSNLVQMNDRISEINTEIPNLTLAINQFAIELAKPAMELDPSTVEFVKDMEQRATERLLRYQYYMAKAYEYRVLKPYPGDFGLEDIVNKIAAMGEGSQSAVLTPDQFDVLKVIYQEQLKVITDRIYSDFTANGASERTGVRYLEITPTDLEYLNKGEQIAVNLYNYGSFRFSSDEQDIRIVDIDIDSYEYFDGTADVETFKFNIEHSGVSKFLLNDNVYTFNHYSVDNTSRIKWIYTFYPKLGKEPLSNKPSAASSSLLSSLVEGGSDDLMQFSRPSAWADLYFNMDADNKPLQKLILKVTFDYTNPEANNSYAPVSFLSEPAELSPTILPMQKDINGRQFGIGEIFRFYNLSDSVSFKIASSFGEWQAKYILNNNGDTVPYTLDDEGNMVVGFIVEEAITLKTYWKTNDTLMLLTPTANELVNTNSELEISWDENILSPISILLLKDGFSYATILDSTTEKTFNWTIPSDIPYSDNYQIKICDIYNNEIYDISEAISITGGAGTGDTPFINLISPSELSKVKYGEEITINYNSNTESAVNIQLLKGGELYKSLAYQTHVRSFNWTIDNHLVIGDDYQIKVVSSDDNTIFDLSTVFKIISDNDEPVETYYLNLLNPSTQEMYLLDTTYLVNWTTNHDAPVRIELLKAGLLYNVLEYAIADTFYYWTVPNSIANGSGYQLRIISTQYENLMSLSPVFSIQNLTSINTIASNSFSIYPNPSQGNIYIQSSESISNRKYPFEISNLVGTIVSYELVEFNQSKCLLTLNHLKPGVYILNSNDLDIHKTIMIK